jgi:hypothetical protein
MSLPAHFPAIITSCEDNRNAGNNTQLPVLGMVLSYVVQGMLGCWVKVCPGISVLRGLGQGGLPCALTAAVDGKATPYVRVPSIELSTLRSS